MISYDLNSTKTPNDTGKKGRFHNICPNKRSLGVCNHANACENIVSITIGITKTASNA